MINETSTSVPLFYQDAVDDANAQRQPLVLCLDTSSSMNGQPIAMLNDAMNAWTKELRNDVNLSSSVEIAVITFGGCEVLTWKSDEVLPHGIHPGAFVPAHSFRPPQLAASGVTLMTEALETAVELVSARKALLRDTGHLYYRPQICLITDGQPTARDGNPTEDWWRVVPLLTGQQQKKKLRLFAIGVGNISPYGEHVLQSIAPKYYARLQGFPFRAVLQMMSASAGAQQKGDGEELFERLFVEFTTQRPAWDE